MSEELIQETARTYIAMRKRREKTHPIPLIETSESERLWKTAQTEEDRQESNRLLLSAVANGCPIANYIYASRLIHGVGFEVDGLKALEHAAAAAQTGFPEAQYLVSSLLKRTVFRRDDQSMFADPGLQHRFLREAAVKGCLIAQVELGTALCANAATQAEGVYYLKLASDADVPADERLRAKNYWNRDLTEVQGIADGALAEHYWKLGPSRNPSLAIHYWRKSAERGNVISKYSLGKVLRGEIPDEEKQGVTETDMATGLMYIQEAADAGFNRAQYEMARMLGTGEIGPRDYSRACFYMEKAAQSGFAPAEFIWGSILWDRHDYAGAVQFFQRAAAQGDAQAIARMTALAGLGRQTGTTTG